MSIELPAKSWGRFRFSQCLRECRAVRESPYATLVIGVCFFWSTLGMRTSLVWQEHISQFQDATDVLLCHIFFLYTCESRTLTAELQRRIWTMEMRCYCKVLGISYKKTMSPTKRLSQDWAGNQMTWRPDHRKEMQTEVVWPCLPFIRSGQNHLARYSEREEEDKADRKRGGKTT